MLTNKKSRAPRVPVMLTNQKWPKATAHMPNNNKHVKPKENITFMVRNNGLRWARSNVKQFSPEQKQHFDGMGVFCVWDARCAIKEGIVQGPTWNSRQHCKPISALEK